MSEYYDTGQMSDEEIRTAYPDVFRPGRDGLFSLICAELPWSAILDRTVLPKSFAIWKDSGIW